MKPPQTADAKARIRQIIHELDMTVESFAKSIGYSRATLAGLLTDKEYSIPIRQSHVLSIEAVYGYSAEWILHGVEPKIRAAKPKPVERKPESDVIYVPVVERAAIAGLIETEDLPVFLNDLPSRASRRPKLDKPVDMHNLLYFSVEGDSMRPHILPGDMLLCALVEDKNELTVDHVYVIVYSSDTDHLQSVKAIKKIRNRYLESGMLDLISTNPEYATFSIRGEQVQRIWRVIRIERDI